MQGFMRDIRSAGQAGLSAEITGPLDKPVFSGEANIAGGRIRHFSLPHALEAINGRVGFDATGIRLDGLTARLGGGLVRFGGRISMNGYTPGEFNLTATGEGMRLRYPEGLPLAGRRRPVAARSVRRAGPRGHRQYPQLGLDAPVRDLDQPARVRRPRHADRSRGGDDHVSPSLRRPVDRAVHAANRQQRRPHRLQCRPGPAGHLRPPAGVRAGGDRARGGGLRGQTVRRSRAGPSTSATRTGSSRSSTWKPRRTCACLARTTSSR